MVRVEVFIVDIFFKGGTKLLNVEINQFALDFYSALPASERPIINFDQTVPDEEIFGGPPIDTPPIEEEPIIEEDDDEPEPIIETTIPGDAVTIVVPNATYGPSPTPGLSRIVLKIVSRLKDKTAMIKDPWLFIQVKDDITQTSVKLEQFQLKPQGIVFQQDYIFDVDTPSKRLSVLVTMFEAASFPISRGRRIVLEYNAGTTPPPDTGDTPTTGSNFLPWVVVTTAAAAFISNKTLKTRKRRR